MSKGMGGKRPGLSYQRPADFYSLLNSTKQVARSPRRLRRLEAKLARTKKEPDK